MFEEGSSRKLPYLRSPELIPKYQKLHRLILGVPRHGDSRVYTGTEDFLFASNNNLTKKHNMLQKTFYLQNRLFRLHIMWSNENIENRVFVSTTSDTSRIKSVTKSKEI